jgi:hypothetical protein
MGNEAAQEEIADSLRKARDMRNGIRIHGEIRKLGLLREKPSLGTSLLKTYAKCGMLAMGNEAAREEIADSLRKCARARDMRNGVRIHGEIRKLGLLWEMPSLGTSLLNMYAKCGMLAMGNEAGKRRNRGFTPEMRESQRRAQWNQNTW